MTTNCGCCENPCTQEENPCDPCAAVESCPDCSPSTVNNMDFFITVTAGFNMPACGNTGQIVVEDATRLYVGALLWNASVGHLVVVSIDDDTHVTVRNDCPTNNVLDPGEPVPADTVFGVGVPAPVDAATENGTGPRLDLDFVIPAIGACVVIKATTTEGLFAGENVSIAGQEYRISGIADLVTLTICNDGSAGPVGDTVEKDPNGDGILDYPIIRIAEQNLCLAEEGSEGKLLICDGVAQKVMVGTIDHQVPAWNNAEGEFKLEVVDSLVVCTYLTGCLVLDPLHVGNYVVEVDDATIFAPFVDEYPGVKIKINGDYFSLVAIVDGTHIRVEPWFTVTEVITYNAPMAVCVADCCEQCSPQLYTLNRFNGPEPREVLFPLPLTEFTIVAATGYAWWRTFPTIAQNGLWTLRYYNTDIEGCNKYVQLYSNFELAVILPEGCFANIEYRIEKFAPVADSKTFWAAVANGGHPQIPELAGSDELFTPGAGIKTLNTFKGQLIERDIVAPGLYDEFRGHLRIHLENTTGAEQLGSVQGSFRAWYTAQDADVEFS